MKEWFTAKELSSFELLKVPTHYTNIARTAERENWLSRARKASGGGKEYHISNLPEQARIELLAKLVKDNNIQDDIKDDVIDKVINDDMRAKKLVKLKIVQFTKNLISTNHLSKYAAICKVKELYDSMDCEAFCSEDYKLIKKFSVRTLTGWLNGENLLDKRGYAKAGSSIYDTDREVSDYILGTVYNYPHITSKTLLRGLKARFRYVDKRLPSYSSVQKWLRDWKQENFDTYLYLSNPDKWRSKCQVALGSRSENITRLNQLWEFDSTPADIMLNDNERWNIIGVIDVYSRRLKLHVTKTSKAEAVVALMRRAILDWGYPEVAKMDNGADYTSKHVTNVCLELGIVQDLCTPFKPEEKPHIERVFKTFSHGFVELLPGFVGHNVAERIDIEARKSFAARIMRKRKKNEEPVEKVFLNLSPEEFQKFCDAWCESYYNNNIHSSIKMTPNEKVASWLLPIRQETDERRLDIALLPKNTRKVTKQGLFIDGGKYISEDLVNYINKTVKIAVDDTNIGLVYVFNVQTNEFICTAEDPELTGINREKVAKKAKQMQKQKLAEETKRIKEASKRANVKDIAKEIMEDAITEVHNISYLPRKNEDYTTNELNEAAVAAHGKQVVIKEDNAEVAAWREEFKQEKEQEQKVVSILDLGSKDKRIANAMKAMALGDKAPIELKNWWINYQQTEEYITFIQMVESFGESKALRMYGCQ